MIVTEQMESVQEQMSSIDRLLIRLLWGQLHSLGGMDKHFGFEKGVKPFYNQWLTESRILFTEYAQELPDQADNLTSEVLHSWIKSSWEEWENRLPTWLSHPDLTAYIRLVDSTIRVLPDILRGHTVATEVMFPDSSMHMVEGIYKHHVIADYFNAVLAEQALAVVNHITSEITERRKVRILEIGAGTGGTSEVVFEKLKPVEHKVQEYCYSDISRAFLVHAEQQYGPSVPYLTYRIADLKIPFAEQGIEPGAYDIIIASNVLHTTRDIRDTLRMIKASLKKDGQLLLNEITSKTVINHLTFGLLEGWWQYADATVRIPGCPALSPANWKKVLKREGYYSIQYPAEGAARYGQQIIAARSDGIVMKANTTESVDKKTHQASMPVVNHSEHHETEALPHAQSNAHLQIVTGDLEEQFVKTAIRESIAEDLKINQAKIQNNRSFSDYGVDSIIAVHLVNVLNRKCNLTLQTTVLFDYNNVDRLTEHILQDYGTIIGALLKQGLEKKPSVTTDLNEKTSGFPEITNIPLDTEPSAAVSAADNKIEGANPCLNSSASGSYFHRVDIDMPSEIGGLRLHQARIQALKPDEVRISVRAFSLNFGDLLCIRGLYPTMPPYPFTPGFEAAGIVVETGTDVTSVKSGDEVVFYADASLGAHSTAITCKAEQVFAKPHPLTYEEACSLPVVAMTVIAAFRKANIQRGERVLIQTATGGVGLVAVQLARHLGAEIFATASMQHKLDYLREMGVKHVINYATTDFEQEIQRRTNGEGVHVILNTLSGDAMQKGLNCLARNGRYIEIAMTALKSAHAVNLSGLNHNQTLYSLDLRKLGMEEPELLEDYRQEMMRWVEQGVIRPQIGQTFPMDRLQEAYRCLDQRGNIGKIVVTVPEYLRYQPNAAANQSGGHVDVSAHGLIATASSGSAHEVKTPHEPVAIIGMSGRFAGSRDVAELWRHLENGDDLIQREQRWNLAEYYGADASYCDQGSFLDNIRAFDPLFFNISGQEAAYMDPQQRIFLEEAWRTLEDGGYAGASMQGRKCGVYVGCTEMDYGHLIGEKPPAQSFWGKAGSIIPARIAYYLDLKGPAIAVDTACSSSLVAIHLACQSLWAKETDMALAGGVFIQSTSQFFLDANRAGMLSSTGRCYTFDERADGFVPGEGAGAVLLKRLSDAVRDGDHIYGVIRGTGINQDGATNGITAPSAKSQTALEKQVYERFHIDPAGIQMVEAHGTGTRLGDPIEFQALTQAFSSYTDQKQYCALGSIKTNIGHLATAAGIAGLIKILLSLQYKRIPASLHMKKGNPNISFSNTPFYVNTETKAWVPDKGKVRRAAISSFGFSGTNAHMVIEEAPVQPEPTQDDLRPGYLIALSARTADQLRQQAERLMAYCKEHPATAIAHMSYTLLEGRSHLAHRLICIARNGPQVVELLYQWLAKGGAETAVYSGNVNRNEQRGSASLKRYAAECVRQCRETDDSSIYLEHLSALCEMYVQGHDIGFNELFPSSARRVPLPTYPFAGDDYWVSARQDDRGSAKLRTSEYPAGTVLHPLVHSNTSSIRQPQYSSVFNGEEFFFKDHLVKGMKVLPGVAHLEWVRFAAESAWGSHSKSRMIRLKNVIWSAPLILDDASSSFAIRFRSVEQSGEEKEDETLHFEICQDQGTSSGHRQLYSQGQVTLADLPGPTWLDIQTELETCEPSPIDAAAFYEASAQTGIRLGPRLQGLKSVYLGADRVIALLSLPQSVADASEPYVLHPSMMDSALQVTIGYLLGIVTDQAAAGRPALPFALEQLDILAPCTDHMLVIAQYGTGSGRNSKVHKLDVDLYDMDGNRCIRMTGFTPRVLEGELPALEERAVRSMVMVPEWTPLDIPSQQVATRYSKHLILISTGFENRINSLRESFPDARCERLGRELTATVMHSKQDPEWLHPLAQSYSDAASHLLEEIRQIVNSGIGSSLIQIVVPDEGEDQLLTGLAGMLMTASREHHQLTCQLIQVHAAVPTEELNNILAAEGQSSQDSFARYPVPGMRQTRVWHELTEHDGDNVLPWRDGGLYLITGGCGGLGLALTQVLVNQVRDATILLNGRSTPDSEQRFQLQQLQINGNHIHYRTADVTSREEVHKLVQDIQSDYGELNGIVHAAGLLKDRALQDKDPEELQSVLSPKVDGTIWLDEATAHMSLDFFTLFSSLAAVTGNQGQGDYACANAFMDAYAAYRNGMVRSGQRNGNTVAINWPLWRDGGMQPGESSLQRIRSQWGMLPMDTPMGFGLLSIAMNSSASQVLAFYGQTDIFLSKLMPIPKISTNQEASRHDSSVPFISNSSPATQREISQPGEQILPVGDERKQLLASKVQDALMGHMSELLQVHRVDIYPDVEFGEYGFDSISFTDFAGMLNEQYSLQLTPTVFFEHSTVRSLSSYLVTTYPEHWNEFLPKMDVISHKLSTDSAYPRTETESIAMRPGNQKENHSGPEQSGEKGSSMPLPEQKETYTLTDSVAPSVLEPVAIIGMSGRFPMADSIDDLWDNLLQGRDCISEIPPDRWDWKDYYGDPEQAHNKTNIKWGGFMEGVAEFDPAFFGISPREAELMDPQQRLLMMYAWRAIEDAGYAPQSLSGTNMGIFVGTASSGYHRLLAQADTVIEGYTSTGHVSSVGPNRMSFFLNVHGPSEPVETACSSSLVALHRAVQAIRNGDCDTAVVGGVNTILDPDYHISFNKAGMLSQDGRCKTFSDEVNGYVRGEGVGMIFLKGKRAAERAGDHIYGLIRATDQNHGGRAASLTAPNPRAQADLIKSVYSKAGVNPSTIGYIEAHGTGTPLGDPIEINGLKTAFQEMQADNEPTPLPSGFCGLGSIKTNIGHLELAAGVAGVIKVLLQMKYRTLVKTVHYQRSNPYIHLEGSPFYIIDENREWEAFRDPAGKELPRRAGVSSFGFGGVNAHVLLEEYVPEHQAVDREMNDGSDRVRSMTDAVPVPIVLSARTEESLLEQARQLLAALQSGRYEDHQLTEMAHTLQTGRTAMEERLAFMAGSILEVKERLEGYILNPQSPGKMYRGKVKPHRATLAALADDADMKETVKNWLRKRKYEQLLDLWVKGLEVPWSEGYRGRKPQRISLPTYPFAKERYWVPGAKTGKTDAHSLTSVLHPLLQRNTSDLRGIRFSSQWSGQEFFLKDHVIQNRKILPGAAYLEMARAAAEQLIPNLSLQDNVIVLRDIHWTTPLGMELHSDTGEMLLTHLGVTPLDKDQVHYEIYSGGDPQVNEPSERIIHHMGTLFTRKVDAYPTMDLETLLLQCGHQTMMAFECYQYFEQAGLNYGPGHQGIQSLHIGHEQVIAQLKLPASLKSAVNEYVLHPALVDSAIQACIGLPEFREGGVTPFALEQAVIYRSCPDSVWAWVRHCPEQDASRTVSRVDIDLYDEQGVAVLELKGLTLLHGPNRGGFQDNKHKDVISERIQQLLPQMQVSGAMTYAPDWREVPSGSASIELAPMRLDGQGMLIGGTSEQQVTVKQWYPNLRHVEALPGTQAEMLERQLKQYGVISHLVWIVPPSQAVHGPEDTPNLMAEQEEGLYQAFLIIKSLLNQGYGARKLELTIVTQRASSVLPGEVHWPAHAGIGGLIGSLAKEMSDWRVCHLDVDDVDGIHMHPEHHFPGIWDGNTRAWRNEKRYENILLNVCPVGNSQEAFRAEGVYVVIGGAGGIGEMWSEYMIRRYGARLIWIGRRKVDERIEASCKRLGAYGIPPLYISADASEKDSLQKAYHQIKQITPVIHGVVHAAVGLMDHSLTQMTLDHFRDVMSAKLNAGVNMINMFGQDSLDFMLFFSSMSSFTKPAGQAGYAAGCAFVDGMAAIAQSWNFPVKVMNWGYWGETGIAGQVPAAFKQRLNQSGIGTIHPEDAMQALELLMAGGRDQLAFIQTNKPGAVDGVSSDLVLVAAPAARQIRSSHLMSRIPDRQLIVESIQQKWSAFNHEFENVLARLLAIQLQELLSGSHSNSPIKIYERWMEKSKVWLLQHSLSVQGLTADSAWAEWSKGMKRWLLDSDFASQVRLADQMIRHLPEMIRGERAATDVMFPDGSMHMVEDIYKNNSAADYFNGMLADTAAAYMVERLEANPDAKLRILEIGAGTGGTTQKVLESLKPYSASIAEYAYTDISKAFLLHGEQAYGVDHPYLKYILLDIDKPPVEQLMDLGGYDLVIAANVLHATRNIQRTMEHVHYLLKRNGLLLLNELTRSSLFSHLTFGLLEGWWLYEDEDIRIKGSPILHQQQWCQILRQTGFGQAIMPAEQGNSLGQQIIAAFSDGYILQPVQTSEFIADHGKLSSTGTSSAKMEDTKVKPDQIWQASLTFFKRLVGEVIKMEPELIDESEPLEAYGIDSILIVQLTNRLRKHFDGINTTLFFEHKTLAALIHHFMKQHEVQLIAAVLPDKPENEMLQDVSLHHQQPVSEAKKAVLEPVLSPAEPVQITASRTDSTAYEPIAIIGISGRYPQADNLEQFWDNLITGKDCISEIPEERWALEGFYHPDRKEAARKGKSYSKWGGFVEGYADFDPLFFQLSPREVMNMDPQERLFLQTVWEALEDSGYTREQMDRQYSGKVGVFAGITKNGFNLYGPPLWNEGGEWFPQTSFSSVANRVSYLLNLHGPSIPVDTMCSSSLTAIHEACESIRRGECEAAIAGGVNLYLHPSSYVALCAQQMLASDGKCKSFAEEADGFVPGEGVGVVILKRLSKAVEDGDQIHAVIRGTHINHGGKTNGYMVPNPAAQGDLIREALDKAGIDARWISYIEAHGTGTRLGDPIEIAGLARAFRLDTLDKEYCSIGSLKSNVGHMESAAGIGGLTKIILQLKHGQIAPSLHAGVLNREIAFHDTPFIVQQSASEWVRPTVEVDGQMKEIPRIAGVSSFGAGGANAHVIVEEYIPVQAPVSITAPSSYRTQRQPGRPVLVVLSARNEEKLLAVAEKLLQFIQRHNVEDQMLEKLAYTLQTGREAMEERLAFAATDIKELSATLCSILASQLKPLPPGVYRGRVNRSSYTPLDTDLEGREVPTGDIRQAVTSGNVNSVLDMWVSGVKLDWQQIYGTETPGKMSLPTYPFEREKYWLPAAERLLHQSSSTDQNADKAASERESVLHPMLHHNTSLLSEQRFSSRFNGEEHFLSDHRVGQHRVLPGVAYLEMAREAVDRSIVHTHAESEVMVLENIIWGRAMVCSSPASDVHIRLYAEEQGEIQYEVYTLDHSAELLHSQGSAFLTSAGSEARLNLHKLRQECIQYWTAAECYQAFEGMGLNYGLTMQGIEAVYTGENTVLAKLVLPDQAKGSANPYVIHPSMADAALQSAIGLLLAEAGPFSDEVQSNSSPLLPFALDRVVIRRPCVPVMWAYVRYSDGHKPSDSLQKLDIELYDEDGNVCIQFEGFTSKPLKGEIHMERSSFPTESQTLMFANEWKEQEAVVVPELVYSRHIVMLSEPWTELEHLITAELPDVKCLTLDTVPMDRTGDSGGMDKAYPAIVLKAYRFVQELLKSKPEGPVLIQLLIANREHYRLFGGLSALLKTAELENPKIIIQIIESEYPSSPGRMVHMLTESSLSAGDTHIRYLNDKRSTSSWKELGIPNTSSSVYLPWKDQGVYLITGGLGAIGYMIAEHIAEQSEQPTIILTGRSELDDSDQHRLAQLEQKGARIVYRRSDVSNRKDVDALMLEIIQKYGMLNGIIHSAGLIRDNYMIRKTLDDIEKVLAPKVAGTVNLDEASQHVKLDFFVLFSSLAGVHGNVGQADYAAANAFMDEYSRYRNERVQQGERYGFTLAINWPLWEEGGMDMDEQTMQNMERISGMVPLARESAMLALQQALQEKKSPIVVMHGEPEQMRTFMGVSGRGPHMNPIPQSSRVNEGEYLQLVDKIRSGECTLDQLIHLR
ncbi:SDR family NAD(P)-dependent oxidoreductase [Paenibacillus sp. UMB7766-LJ446]|uniref:SDR family NAD(P)-dependent oxidoreductase n=1 Tax=Paenibacillus sp. UMB7766-LJ446 TaxID=3046313 RepID=UPI00254B6587|nr:SDR family NAD(P)-dependent oxidoreductase [Paenibacillus sp. UMB7766-LJ446]MDK8189824.1 SDR family NAD(P)-dependent oxidoreductase [Paenibacillus sp. UMB7766-LJ446]